MPKLFPMLLLKLEYTKQHWSKYDQSYMKHKMEGRMLQKWMSEFENVKRIMMNADEIFENQKTRIGVNDVISTLLN